MYRQPSQTYGSTDSLRRLSSNNPFRQHVEQPIGSSQIEHPTRTSLTLGSDRVPTPPTNFEDWIEKNKQLIDGSDEDDVYEEPSRHHSTGHTSNSSSGDFAKPVFPPRPVRADSDSSVNYSSKKMASNNPFAAALNEPDSYVHRRDPPPPPRQQLHSLDGSGSPKIHSVNLHTKSSTPPARPPKASSALPPPSYEEVAGPDGVRREYPREKVSSSSNGTSQTSASRHGHPHGSSGRPHRSHSDSGRPSRSSREKSSGRSGSSGSGTRHHHASSHHHKSSSSRNKSPSKKKPEAIKAKNLDTIDKLDVTAFFGSGFHHDGPFDACTPHRNKNAKSAPVAAFPVDGPNNSIAGLKGNVDKNEQMNLAFGTYEDGPQNEIVGRKQSVRRNGPVKDDFPTIKTRSTNDAAFTPKQNPSVINFDSNLKAEPIHGSTTAGLGSTTFVDGAPAPKIAEQNEYLSPSNGGGLNRKKSLVQRLRKNSNSENSSRRNSHETTLSAETGRRGSLNNFDSNDESKPQSGVGGGTSSLIKRVKSLKVRR